MVNMGKEVLGQLKLPSSRPQGGDSVQLLPLALCYPSLHGWHLHPAGGSGQILGSHREAAFPLSPPVSPPASPCWGYLQILYTPPPPSQAHAPGPLQPCPCWNPCFHSCLPTVHRPAGEQSHLKTCQELPWWCSG